MNKIVQEAAARDLNRAILANEESNTSYNQILRRFISVKSSFPEESLCKPDAILDASGLKEIGTAWLKLNNTEKKLRGAYMKLYVAYL
jgi:hypothetical protein